MAVSDSPPPVNAFADLALAGKPTGTATTTPTTRDDDSSADSPNEDPKHPTMHPPSRHLPLPKVRPETQRSTTDPSPVHLLQAYFHTTPPANAAGSSSNNYNSNNPSSTRRTRSPYSRSHLRSRSSGAALGAPMIRAHSSPSMNSRPSDLAISSTASPMRSPARTHSPLRLSHDAANTTTYHGPPRSPTWHDAPTSGGAIPSIQEDSELDLNSTPRPTSQPPTALAPFSRSSSLRRRPASPLHSVTNATAPPPSIPASVPESQILDTPTSVTSSPSLAPQKFNETYPTLHHYASSSSFSSMPSTPSSARSRSPSISSLETIEDAPDAESEAIEAERIMRLKLAVERAERRERGEEDGEKLRRGSFEGGGKGFGFRLGSNLTRERKRWSVCGAERRVDLDLDTIWED